MSNDSNRKPGMTGPFEILERHARTWVPCGDCWERFERLRQRAGLGRCTAIYCEHNGVRVAWTMVHIQLDICETTAEHERMNQHMRKFLAQAEQFSEIADKAANRKGRPS